MDNSLRFSEEQWDRLRKHYLALSELVLRQMSDSGAVLVRNAEGEAYEDPVCTHHLVEWTVSCQMDPLAGIRYRALSWLAENNALPKDPFALDSFLVAGVEDQALGNIAEQIAQGQLKSGLISFYTAYLHGGDHFSTLWGVKILMHFGDRYQEAIVRALAKCVEDKDEFFIMPSHAGFLLLLLDRVHDRFGHFENDLAPISRRILESQDATTGLWSDDPFASAFVAYDLAALKCPHKEQLVAARQAISGLFSLDTPPDSLPDPIRSYRDTAADGAFIEMLLRSFIASNMLLHVFEMSDPSEDLGHRLVGIAPSLFNAVDHLIDRTKKLEVELSKVRRIPEAYREEIKAFLEDSPYECNVLVMITFGFKDQDMGDRYVQLMQIIRDVLASRGLTAFIVTDKEWDETLWGNLQVYLSACCAGIAVFDNFLPERVHNPNVAMEAGYLMAMGKPVAILKDKSLPRLPTDWAGHLYLEFPQHKLDAIRRPLSKWLIDKKLGSEQ